jgi:hypothetical protein
LRFLALQRLRPRRAVRICHPPDDPASTFQSPIDRRSCVDPSDFRPCGFSLGNDDETADSLERISESRRRRYVPGSCAVGPSLAVFRYPEIDLSSRPGRILRPDNVPGLLPFAVLILPRQRRACFHVDRPTCRFPRIRLDAFCSRDRPSDSTDRYGSYASSPTRISRSNGPIEDARTNFWDAALSDRALPAGKPFATKAAGTSAPTSFCRRRRSCHELVLSQVSRAPLTMRQHGHDPVRAADLRSSHRHRASAPGRSTCHPLMGLAMGFASRSEMHGPDVSPMTSLPSLPFSVLKGPTPCRSD